MHEINTKPTLHLVGGFLGSGKTTAIINACKQLTRQGKRVGVITNDQGKYLVDTAFFRLADFPTVEVGGGCFCCNFIDLEKELDGLMNSVSPDVIFAESVGSCADIVATVVKPLLEFESSKVKPSSFSVFVDARLLLFFLNDIPLPFSDDVMYIFEEQILEGSLVILNKADLLDGAQMKQLLGLAVKRWPEKVFLPQVSLSEEGVTGWLGRIESGQAPLPDKPLEINYQRYGSGEKRLAWLDESLQINSAGLPLHLVAAALIKEIMAGLKSQALPVGHVKFVLTAGKDQVKVSLTSIDEPGWEKDIPDLCGKELHVLINARVECPAADLLDLVNKAVESARMQTGIDVKILNIDAFHPNDPHPTYRLA